MFKKILSHTLCALIGTVAGAYLMSLFTYYVPDYGFIIRSIVKDKMSKEDVITAFNESFERWN